jgi:hypothetical protein
LFRILAGRSAEPMPILPRNGREAQLIKAVRREEEKRVAEVSRELRAARVREALEREKAEEDAVIASASHLRARYAEEPLSALPAEHRPCLSERAATVECYREHGASNPALCAGQVDRFAACARKLHQ